MQIGGADFGSCAAEISTTHSFYERRSRRGILASSGNAITFLC
jgi:hypothetical protein